MRFSYSFMNHRLLGIADLARPEYKRCTQGGDHEETILHDPDHADLQQSACHSGEQV
jgi:hypothetical protein